MNEINLKELKFDKITGLIPVIVQNDVTKEVLMLAYMNEESLQLSLNTGECWFYSRSRKELWHKGERSGNFLKIVSIFYDCDKDALLVRVNPDGPACHTGNESCFYQYLLKKSSSDENPNLENVLSKLYNLIINRKLNPLKDSYTCYLFREGSDKILKKIGEEAAEVIIGAKNNSREEIVYEMADLTYHLLVLLAEKNIYPDEVGVELIKRSK